MSTDIDILTEDPRWADVDLALWGAQALRVTLDVLGLPQGYVVSVLACDDARVAVLNADFRGKPSPTNVLSWPACEYAARAPGERPGPPVFDNMPDDDMGEEWGLGDIALAYDTCAREAQAAGLSFEHHITHLFVHGVLHLLGFDHIDDQDAALMEGLETQILEKLGIADPYSVMGFA